MRMSRFDILTKYIPINQEDNIGEWVFDKENGGTHEHPRSQVKKGRGFFDRDRFPEKQRGH